MIIFILLISLILLSLLDLTFIIYLFIGMRELKRLENGELDKDEWKLP